jgi:hypothetical protein
LVLEEQERIKTWKGKQEPSFKQGTSMITWVGRLLSYQTPAPIPVEIKGWKNGLVSSHNITFACSLWSFQKFLLPECLWSPKTSSSSEWANCYGHYDGNLFCSARSEEQIMSYVFMTQLLCTPRLMAQLLCLFHSVWKHRKFKTKLR